METNEGRVYFALDGDDFDPDSLTEFLGVEPTSIMRKGTRIPEKSPAKSSWEFSTENIVNNFIDVFAMAESITEQLEPKKTRIIEAIDKFNLVARLEVVLWISMNEEHSTPAIGFEPNTIKFLSEVGAFIDVDTYKH
ncbi:DUF4279 domain-containing protein [Marinicella litoralis]|uniref:Uncharacterized protein DUF4279 n=1 Tax=Marinicella litoralis TaxID=644220 RepID=A0A4R6XRP7_9GAMM|nr:DUF4279 domain-containing protein [Marinicella litoralis]TDR20587.1 uncharacterized protein DUF4279 [Marinicella litoralis]